MSCCNGPIIVYPRCAPDCPDVPAYVFQNDNLIGEGVWNQTADGTVGFRGVTNTDGTIIVTLDTVNNAISIDLNAELLAGSFPDATTTSKGKVELAIDAEAQAKTSTTVVLTPSNLAALGATTTFAGLVELATDAEAQAGTSTTLAITPASLALVTGPALKMGLGNVTSSDTTFDFSGAKFELTAGSGLYRFNGSGLRIEGQPLVLATGGDLNFNGGKLKVTGVDVPAESVLGTTASSGVPTSYELGSFIRPAVTNYLTGATELDLTGGDMVINGSGFTFTFNDFEITNSFPFSFNTGSTVNFNGGHIQVSGVDVPADSFIRTDSAAGIVTSELVALYFGPHTVTEDYFIDPFIANRSFDPATVTLPNLAIVVASLIQDLAAVHKPNLA